MPQPEKEAQKRINQTLEVWENLRPKKSFAGMTLAQFKAILKRSLDSRAEITNLRNQLKGTIRDRSKILEQRSNAHREDSRALESHT